MDEEKKIEKEYLVPAYPINHDEFTLKELWDIFYSNIYILLTTTSVIVVLSVIYALILPPMYQSQVMMVNSDQNDRASQLSGIANQFGGLASLAGINLGSSGGNDVLTSISILQSRSFIIEFINANDLKPILFEDQYDQKDKSWEDNTVPSDWDAHEIFSSLYVVDYDEFGSPVITLSLEWYDPIIAASWANLLVDKLNEYTKKEAMKDSEKSIEFLEIEISNTSNTNSKQILFQMIEQQMNKQMLANSSDQYEFRIIDRAVPAQEKHKPKRRVIVLLGTLLGIALSIIIILIKELLRKLELDISISKFIKS